MKNVLFQVHWFLGITAGIVLAVVGVTGAMLSFEHELLAAMNPGVITVQARAPALAPAELVARIRAAAPDKAIQSLTLSADPETSARVGFAPAPGAAPGGPGGRPRGESRYVDPYTGALLGQPQGEGFFRTTMQIHRWLAADAVGKQIVGASTLALVYFCLSGLYLRWPRRWNQWRSWLALDWAQKGRSFLWHLHAVVGTWVLFAFLVMALTGLQWSYEWYRNGLYALAGAPMQQRGPGGPGGGAGGQDRRGAAGGERAPAVDIAAAFGAFSANVPAWSSVTLRLPQAPGQPLEFGYLDPDPAHERANNRLALAADFSVDAHERYDDKPAGQKLVSSIFPLHSGSFFGLPGLILFMVASATMPLFAITGWMLYLNRRRRKKAALAAAATLATTIAPANVAFAHPPEATVVAYASQTGTATRLAWQTAASLQAGGVPVRVVPLETLDLAALAAIPRLLVVASTFGEGEPPDPLRAFARRMLAQPAALPKLRYGLLALGDRSYDDFCGFGHRLATWLRQSGATPLFDPVEVDDGDDGALRHWQHHLGVLAGTAALPDWVAPSYQRWRLLAREHVNAGSPGGALYRLALQAPDGADWRAGDIAEIGPGAFAAAAALPHREYSIASLASGGVLELLVRQMHASDGRLGLGSAWLTRDAHVGDDIALRIRSNAGFHPPADDRPLLLIGNGTGIAGLRALLLARIAAGHRRNWLLFGERTAAHDRPFADDLAAATAMGFLAATDLVFSRDGGANRYVQDVLRERAAGVRQWIADGAAIYVCGSLEGMAPGVEAALVDILGAPVVEELAETGRYRRDVY